MKTAFLTAMSGILTATCISYPVEAHQTYTMRRPLAKNFMALSAIQTFAGTVLPDGVALRGSPNDPLSTATGGPSGGLPDGN